MNDTAADNLLLGIQPGRDPACGCLGQLAHTHQILLVNCKVLQSVVELLLLMAIKQTVEVKDVGQTRHPPVASHVQ